MSSPKSKKKKGPPTPEEIDEEEKRSKLAMKAAMRTRMRKVTGEKVGAVYEAFAFTSESEAVDLTNKGLGEGAGESFGSVLIHQGLGSEDGPASGLAALTVKTNLLGPAGCASLCKALDPLYLNTRLAKLDLQENSIGVAGAKSIAAMLAINGTVHTLHLGSNKMGPDGAKAIADALPNNAALTWLSLRANDVANQGCPPLSAAHFGILERLELRDNNIGNTGMDKLAAGTFLLLLPLLLLLLGRPLTNY